MKGVEGEAPSSYPGQQNVQPRGGADLGSASRGVVGAGWHLSLLIYHRFSTAGRLLRALGA